MTQINNKSNLKDSIKSWRLIVRNLPFDTKEDDLKSAFAKFGEIKEITLPKCKDKRFPNSCAGFCFVQYAKKKGATFAKDGINGMKIKNREVTVDWSLDKDSYVTKKLEGEEQNIMEKKLKNIEKKINGKHTVKDSSDDESEHESNENENDQHSASDSSDDEDDESDSETRSNNSSSDSSMEVDEQEEKKKIKAKKPEQSKMKEHKEDTATAEGRVVFLRNIDFGASNETIKDVASKYGTVSFAIQCNYPGTDQPSGTAFVHFEEKSSADAFLDDILKPEGVSINNRKIFGHRAVPRSEATQFKTDSKHQPKDNRNLYLLRASLIREGTSQARGMSEQDCEMRKRLAELARNKLKNLTMFVSPTRLAIHNIPFNWNDQSLRKLCSEIVKSPSAVITECRIMRDKVGTDAKGHAILGRSKGFGFVAFENHADALNCLRQLNNNLEAFTKERRPIVEFSIENLSALRIKEQRQKDKNQKSKGAAKFSVKDPAVLEQTKASLRSGGQKWMPKRLGAKVRHRDLMGKKKNIKQTKQVRRKPQKK